MPSTGQDVSVGQRSPLLRLTAISKQFPGCLANDAVDLAIQPGEIHALLGENGAGKSTLVKIIYGVQQPDQGEIAWQGAPVRIGNPAQARQLGIGMVFQHFSLFESLTVTENIALGISDPEERRGLAGRIAAISANYGLPLDPQRAVHDLSVGERQRVEIVRCLLQHPKLLIMDEPTSVLTPQEVDKLFATLRRLSEEGCAILYISHKLEEIRSLCRHATIMRQGRVVAECDPRRETAEHLAELMIGTRVAAARRGQITVSGETPRLEVTHLSLRSEQKFGTDLVDISFAVRPGEILGIAGIAGNGQGELMAALSGEVRLADAGTIRINGISAGQMGPARRRRLKAAFVPEERNGHGAVGPLALDENAFLSAYDSRHLVDWGLINGRRMRDFAGRIIAAFDVRCRGVQSQARALSGGNLQKFIVGREILQEPELLIVAQPTWGVDAGAAAAIHQALLDLAARGAAIVVISQDLDEILAVCQRIAVINLGRLSVPRPVEEVSVEEIGLLMGGIHDGRGHADPAAGDRGMDQQGPDRQGPDRRRPGDGGREHLAGDEQRAVQA
ncbi:MAG TPA: ABC transporter ATP-binding protein [Dongiaceae bacterium]|nr:ABC transporter ATP-binding protein [Dongiaceae bacterium]